MAIQIYTDNNGLKIELETLKKCPFCNDDADLIFIGNNATKARSVRIKCVNPYCGSLIVKAGIHSPTILIATNAVQAWNKRANPSLP